MRQSGKRFAFSLVQRKGLVKNSSLVYLHKYNWPTADKEEVKGKAWTEREGQGLNWEAVCGIPVLLTSMYLQKETVLFVPANIFKVRLEKKMEELPPNQHAIDLEEQKLTTESVYFAST